MNSESPNILFLVMQEFRESIDECLSRLITREPRSGPHRSDTTRVDHGQLILRVRECAANVSGSKESSSCEISSGCID